MQVAEHELLTQCPLQHSFYAKKVNSNIEKESISTTFYSSIFRTKALSKTNSKQRKDFRMKNACVKC